MSDSSQIVAPALRSLGALSELLNPWLRERLGDVANLELSNLDYPRGAGMSHETILLDAAWDSATGRQRRGYVVRIKPTTHTVYQDDMFEAQWRLMRLMRRSGLVRVAEVFWADDDPSLLGAPFFVMEKINGRVAVSYPPYAQQGWVVDASSAQRERMWVDAVSQLALIQRVDVAEAAFLSNVVIGFEQEADRWTRFLDWIDPDGARAMLRRAHAALMSNLPANRAEGIVWGDARLGNMMIANDYRVAAVMDWEQPSTGGALHDLAWWLYSDYVQTVGRGLPPLDGMGSRQQTVDLWQRESGKSATDIEWYEAFAVFKMECLGVRLAALRGAQVAATMTEPGLTTLEFLAKLQ